MKTNEELFEYYQQTKKNAISTFIKYNLRYSKNFLNQGGNKFQINGEYEDLCSEADLILWEMIISKETFIEGELMESGLLHYKLLHRFNNWHIKFGRTIKLPKRVVKGQQSYNKIFKKLDKSLDLIRLNIKPESVLEVWEHPAESLLPDDLREDVNAYRQTILTLTRKPYDRFIKHILSYTLVENNEEWSLKEGC